MEMEINKCLNTKTPDPFVLIKRDKQTECALTKLAQSSPGCFLCGSAVLNFIKEDAHLEKKTENAMIIFKIELFKKLLCKFNVDLITGANKRKHRFCERDEICKNCLLVIQQVWELQEQLDAARKDMNKILQNFVKDLPSNNSRNKKCSKMSKMDTDPLSNNSEIDGNSGEEIVVKFEVVCSDYEDNLETVSLTGYKGDGIPNGHAQDSNINSSNCNSCGELFPTQRNWAIHQVIGCDLTWEEDNVRVLGSKLKRCDFPGCGEVFVRFQSWKSHSDSHLQQMTLPTEESIEQDTFPEPLCCSFCGATFSSQYNLHWHEVRVHGKESAFLCSSCGKEYSTQKGCTMHEVGVCKAEVSQRTLNKLEISKGSCKFEGCEKIFWTDEDLKKHIQNEHKEGRGSARNVARRGRLRR